MSSAFSAYRISVTLGTSDTMRAGGAASVHLPPEHVGAS